MIEDRIREISKSEDTCECIIKWIEEQACKNELADKDVLGFIGLFVYKCGEEVAPEIRYLFSHGYCYFFAMMLKDAFERGELYIPMNPKLKGHIVWVDTNGIAYDINGVYTNYNELMPIKFYEDFISDFKHIPSRPHRASRDDREEITKKYYESLIPEQYKYSATFSDYCYSMGLPISYWKGEYERLSRMCGSTESQYVDKLIKDVLT